jgi:hypothetical protein
MAVLKKIGWAGPGYEVDVYVELFATWVTRENQDTRTGIFFKLAGVDIHSE